MGNSIKRAGTVAITAFAIGAAGAHAQEITNAATTTAKPMSANLVPIDGAMLEKAGGDAKNWIHANGNYANTRYYPGARHELLNETNRDEVTADLIAWLDRVCPSKP